MSVKNVLITGASHGIGQGIAVAFARAGYNVGINYNGNTEGAEKTLKLVTEAGAAGKLYKANVGDYSELQSLVNSFADDFGTIDVMVNNAGISEFHPLLETKEEEFDRITAIDWKGTYFGTQFAARKMVEKGTRGVILNMSSNHIDTCFPNANVYAPSKAAVAQFTKNAALELGAYGIRVVSISPGYIDVWTPDARVQNCRPRIPLKTFGNVEDVAELFVYVASDKCSYMTGNRIVIDGGSCLPSVAENALDVYPYTERKHAQYKGYSIIEDDRPDSDSMLKTN